MPESGEAIPLSREEVVDRYFLDARAKAIDVAAFLDRVDRATPRDPRAGEDFRVRALREVLAVLLESKPGRAKRVLDRLSDHSTEPIDSAAGMKGAFGAPAPTRADAGEGASTKAGTSA